ncbi:hypothetical protein ASPZODRAFT_152503 [Penicilliopsis zonata CBS 506.65]|uniref:Uncharacterized protein n=1 Tax=Penicilliopsis zonata CBS 506.65 TaxID=1073090 RepID=A0A1L9SGM5_9EURO|nr:hypothetical protein ASPZODRAFT_152503 [Penicilliopsis zonata CBS 506.65]OJJ46321.1 hypothetical protein ASPZODRAFT_152503 [Penicilliopsis zonata CBS 506.65]
MALRQLQQLQQLPSRYGRSKLSQCVILPLRQFSQTTKSHQQIGRDSPASEQKTAVSKPSPSSPRKPGSKPGANRSGANRSKRVIDARSFGATQADAQSTKIFRGPKSRSARNESSPRGPRTFNALPVSKSVKRSPKTKAGNRSRPSRKQEEGEGENEARAAQIEKVFLEQKEKETQQPVRYTPQQNILSQLQETWPSLPTDETGRVNSVVEKLLSLSERYPNGYVSPQELGKRLFHKQNVLFMNEEEKNQAVDEANKLAQQRADRLSQRKGELVEAEAISLAQISGESGKGLLESLVAGKYPKQSQLQSDRSPVLLEVLKNLGNNQTYNTAGKTSQFITKLESLIGSKPSSRKTQ